MKPLTDVLRPLVIVAVFCVAYQVHTLTFQKPLNLNAAQVSDNASVNLTELQNKLTDVTERLEQLERLQKTNNKGKSAASSGADAPAEEPASSPEESAGGKPEKAAKSGGGGGPKASGAGGSAAAAQPKPAPPATTTNAEEEYPIWGQPISENDANRGAKMTPYKSRAPPSIPLLKPGIPDYQTARHECIQSIRERQLKLFRPWIVDPGDAVNDQEESAILIDPAFHSNVGDHMLVLGEHAGMKMFGYPKIAECGYGQAMGYAPRCEHSSFLDPHAIPLEQRQEKSNGKYNKLALWHAGGNWGTLWEVNSYRLPSIKYWLKRNYTVIGMPQSYYYQNEKKAKEDARKIQHIVDETKAADRLVLTWREQYSYDEAQKMYPQVTNVLSPDIAFQLGPYYPLETPLKKELNLDLILFMRTDKESALGKLRSDEAMKKELAKVDGAKDLKFKIVDWSTRLKLFDSRDHWFTVTAIQMLTLGKVVICDRLHASILCYLAGIPFVYIDQMTSKVTKTLSVAFDSSEGCQDGKRALWARAYNMQQALEQAMGMMEELERRKNGDTSGGGSGRTIHWGFTTPKPARI